MPRGFDATEVSNLIRDILHRYEPHGEIVEKRLYFGGFCSFRLSDPLYHCDSDFTTRPAHADSRKNSEIATDRVALDLSGFVLVDCPSRGQKETLDKKVGKARG